MLCPHIQQLRYVPCFWACWVVSKNCLQYKCSLCKCNCNILCADAGCIVCRCRENRQHSMLHTSMKVPRPANSNCPVQVNEHDCGMFTTGWTFGLDLISARLPQPLMPCIFCHASTCNKTTFVFDKCCAALAQFKLHQCKSCSLCLLTRA